MVTHNETIYAVGVDVLDDPFVDVLDDPFVDVLDDPFVDVLDDPKFL